MKRKKILFLLISILLTSLIALENPSNIQADDWITYNLKDPPSITGNLLGAEKASITAQYWRTSGGIWRYTLEGFSTIEISDSKMQEIIGNPTETINEDIVLIKDLPSSVINYINAGNDINNLKVKIQEPPNTDFIQENYRDLFQYKIDTNKKKIVLKFRPLLPVVQKSNFWEGSVLYGVIPTLPLIEENCGYPVFAMWRINGTEEKQLDYDPFHPNKLNGPDEIRLVGNDGFIDENKQYMDSAGNYFSGADWKIGNGTFKNGGAMGLNFIYSFDIEYYDSFVGGDFEILMDGSNVTDSFYSVNIGESNYGQNHAITLKYTGPTNGISNIKWRDDLLMEYTAFAPNFTVQANAKGGESPGKKTNYFMEINYTNGNVNADTYHHVTITENKTSSGGGNGNITFTPSSSFNVSGNREGWVNSNISVRVRVTGDTTKTVSGYANWGYRYEEWDEEEQIYIPRNSSTSRDFTETWEINSIRVSGSGKNASGSTVSLPSQTISGTSGNYTISSELRDIQLQAEIVDWKSKSRSWKSGSAPRGSWESGSPPSGRTTKPTEKYNSTSGLYYLDKGTPTLVSVSPSSKSWTNSQITIPINIRDNFSGFWNPSTYFEVIDSSYLRQSTIKQNYIKGSTNETKNAVINRDGIYSINIYAEDIAKNKMNNASYGQYKYDSTSPYAASFSSDNRSYIDDDLRITVTVGDNLSGIVETKYVLNNSPSDNSGMSTVACTTPEGQSSYNTFNVNITQPGSWWIHVTQRDRAGNTRTSVSPEYKIVRLGEKTNKSGKTYDLENNNCLWINPDSRIPRGTRFDVILRTFGLTKTESLNSNVFIQAPRWADDDVDKKVNREYVVTPGNTIKLMNYYTGKELGSQGYASSSTESQWWLPFIPPFGTPLTKNRKGERLKNKYEFEVYLQFNGYSPSRTRTSKVTYDVIPETKIKTQIINNEF